MSMNTQTTGCRFYPVQCSDKVFQTLTPADGHLYFVTDKKKLFLGKDNKMIPMCASSGIFYGKKGIRYDNSGIKPNPNVTFIFSVNENESEIEGLDKPELDDLILNVGTPELEDGCFYRVVRINENNIETTRLTLQGTGGGGGGGGSVPGGSTNFTISMASQLFTFPSTATEMNISFRGNYNGDQENAIMSVRFHKSGEAEPFYIYTGDMPFNEYVPIDLYEYRHLFAETKTQIDIYVQDLYGNERSTYFTVQIVELALEARKEKLLSSFNSTYNYTWYFASPDTGLTDKQITFTFYDQDNLNHVIGDPQVHKVDPTDRTYEMSKDLDLSGLAHGTYVLKVVASARISGTRDIIYSNELVHKISHFTQTGNPILSIIFPERTEQHTDIPMDYLFLTDDVNKGYTLEVKVDGEVQTNLAITSNIINNYSLYFDREGNYTITATIVELQVSYTTYLKIVPYTGVIPVIDPSRADLMLYLNPRGKSNTEVDKNEWADFNGTHVAQLHNLHYGLVNGWMTDEKGIKYLKLSSGASLTIPGFKPFEFDPTRTSAINDRMGYGMTIEVDFEISGVLDYDVDIIKCYSENQYKTKIPVGFRITGDKIYFYNSRLSGGEETGSLLSLNIAEGKRIRLTFVIEPNNTRIDFPMVYAYLDGKLSGAAIYQKSIDQFIDGAIAAQFQVFSDAAQVKLYGVRFYSTALSDRVILNNYTASLDTLAEKEAAYNSNNVFGSDGNISYALVAASDYDLQIPYMKITGGWATEKESKWQLKDITSANAGLPTGKKDYRLIDVEVKYPKNGYFAKYKDYSFINKFASGNTMDKAYGEKPSNGGAIMYAQGTSSMEYPVKNLRLRFKNEEDWYKVRPDIANVEIICMKADYMESSGSHNTGAANFIDALYGGVNMQTPGQEHFGGAGKDTIVTCIKGHPCLIFYSKTGEPGSYQYIGKYNLNLDKATPEPFGFDHDDSDFGYLPEGATYYDIKYNKDGEYIAGQVETEKTVQAGEKINSIHCFEFLDNAVEVCNFLPKAKNYIKNEDGNLVPDPTGGYYTYENSWYGTFVNADQELVPGWTLGFESRYPEDKVGYHDADSLYPLASWLNTLYTMRVEELAADLKPTDYENIYKYEVATKIEPFTAYFELVGGEYIEVYPESVEEGKVYYTRSVVDTIFAMESLNRFKKEYQRFLDKDFLLTYYLVTEALLMADSRVKNMMIATWGIEDRYKILSTGTFVAEKPEDGTVEYEVYPEYVFYPIFYDMDTMLGLDNTGVYRFNYYDEDTNASVFNGDEVLWNFVRDALGDELKVWYSNLEAAALTAEGVLPYFNDNQADMANGAFYNGDANYKYIRPAREGYEDLLHGKYIEPGAAPFLYAAQGDRSLMREWFLTNRMKFLRGKYTSGMYQSGDRIEFRWYYPSGNETEFQGHSASVAPECAEPSGIFEFTSLKTSYAGVKLGANGNVYDERFDGEQKQKILLPEAASANGTEAYLLGLSNLSDLGDLSNKYMQKFIIGSNDCRLKHLTLGNPHKDYYNPYWRPGTGGQSQEIKISGCTYLETFNLQNCSTYNGNLDFSPCPAIKKILLTGSSTSGLILPINGMLEELRLPNTINTINIESHPKLTADKFSIGIYDYGTATKIGEGNGYINDYSGITNLYVVDTPINTYDIITTPRSSLEAYHLQNIHWDITTVNELYCEVSEEEFKANPGEHYYYYDSRQQQYTDYIFTNYPSEYNLFKLSKMIDNDYNLITIPALDYLLTKKLKPEVSSHADALSGTIFVNIPAINGNKIKVDELFIYEKYRDVYPKIKISYGTDMQVNKAITINFYSVTAEELESGVDISEVEPYFYVLTGPNRLTLQELITGTGFTNPVGKNTNTTIYEFTGAWYDWNETPPIRYYQDELVDTNKIEDKTKLFSNFKPSKDMNLVPIFEAVTKKYAINFYNHDHVIGGLPLFTLYSEYNKPLINVAKNEPKVYYLYRSDEDLENELERYTLKGWQSEADFNNNTVNPTLINLNTNVVTDMNLFTYYEIEDVTQNASPMEIFNISNNTVSLNDDYADLVGGKITIPSKDASGNNINMIGSFAKGIKISEVYFLPDAQHTGVGKQAFLNSEVKSVYLPNTIKHINDEAFKDADKLENINLSNTIETLGNNAFYSSSSKRNLNIAKLPESLISIGDQCFYNGGPGITVSDLPLGVKTIGSYAFQDCANLTIHEFPAHPDGTICSIGQGAFVNSCKVDSVTEITINSPWSLPKEKTYYGVFGRAESNGADGYSNVTVINVHTNLYNALGGTELDVIEACFGEVSDDKVDIYEEKFTVANISETLEEV